MVTIAFGRWDNHSNVFQSCRDRIPKLDMALSTLVEDLHLRGLDKDVSVVVWGEFGRTPKINKNAGRDHWAPVNLRPARRRRDATGQVIGSTDKEGAYAKTDPSRFRTCSPRSITTSASTPPLPLPIEAAGPCAARRPAADPRAGLKLGDTSVRPRLLLAPWIALSPAPRSPDGATRPAWVVPRIFSW